MSIKTTTGILSDQVWARWTALLLLALGMFCAYIFMEVL